MSEQAEAPTRYDDAGGGNSGWEDTPDYPHRIENHVKVYLHLEETETRPVLATAATAPEGTRVYRRTGTRGLQYGTVTGWTTEGGGVFVSFDQAGTYAGPTFDALWLADSGSGPRWVVSPVTVDGYPLDGVEDGHYCDYEGHPPGARPDWDRQHREAANVYLPTAEELLPLLATALGNRMGGPSVEQLSTASDLIAEHAEWRSTRAGLSEEAGPFFPPAGDWQASDDAGCDLADRAIALLTELTGQQAGAEQQAGSPGAAAALQRSMLQPPAETHTPSTHPDPPTPASSRPPSPGR
ncbi:MULTISPECIES: hypothetical protein [unclassified Nocardioides]|uniref:hypothetical protein n=1 Tax=unclassified Nocardioides TaxID=2615069 RepID=UPI0009F1207D|nr:MULTISPECIES: hypothetical protein [unclassified Nocardioides]GAW52541.1 uncharacterized protein PD653B2_4899 [Nocardioides sp. PD653-B2]GAW55575.1 uncharacterized protein PD653_3000 [Nocardioides sp. PD653]